MGVLARLRDALKPVETRDGGWGLPTYSFGSGVASVADVNTAENLATVQGCVQAIASGLASLPARVYQTTAAGRVEAPGHPVSRLIRAPNSRQTWPDFIEWLMGSVLLHGNAVAEIVSDGAGRPIALNPIPWSFVSAVVLPSGTLGFDVVAYSTPWGGTGAPRRLLADEVLYLKDRSDDGWIGRSRISRSPGVVAAATGLATFTEAIWENAATPSGMVTFAPGASKEGKLKAMAHFEARTTGAANARKIVYVEGDSKFTPFSVSPEDAETLASRQFTVTELCRLFGVPPPIIQDYSRSTFTNAAQAELWFASRTLLPWATKIEAEFSRSVFSDPSFSLDIDLSGLQRGDYASLMQTNTAAVAAKILTVNEAREAAGYSPMATNIDVDAASPPD